MLMLERIFKYPNAYYSERDAWQLVGEIFALAIVIAFLVLALTGSFNA